MTGRMMEALEKEMLEVKPDMVLVYGDTNSTLAGALAAAKLHIPVAHVEAGLRSWNRAMPEEINRVLTDHVAQMLFCPTKAAVENLWKEGMGMGVHLTGDVMYDAALHFREKAEKESGILLSLGLQNGKYALATIHRAENTDDETRLRAIAGSMAALSASLPVVFPAHPRTRNRLAAMGLANQLGRTIMINPVGYLDMIKLESSARLIVTDSGGVQKEAYFFQKPCITLRTETEWVETVATGWNRLSGVESGEFMTAVGTALSSKPEWEPIYGEGNASSVIAGLLAAYKVK